MDRNDYLRHSNSNTSRTRGDNRKNRSEKLASNLSEQNPFSTTNSKSLPGSFRRIPAQTVRKNRQYLRDRSRSDPRKRNSAGVVRNSREYLRILARRFFIPMALVLAIAILVLTFLIDAPGAPAGSNMQAAPTTFSAPETSAPEMALKQAAGPALYPVIEEPQKTELMVGATAQAAQETVRFYYKAYDYAMATGDISAIRSVMDPQCRMCLDAIAQINSMHANGHQVLSGQVSDLSLSTSGGESAYTVHAKFVDDGYTVLDSNGVIVRSQAPRYQVATWTVRMIGNELRLVAAVVR